MLSNYLKINGAADYFPNQLAPSFSDHHPIVIELEEIHDKLKTHVKLIGISHNMLNKGHDNVHCYSGHYSNNPYNVQESLPNYLQRKSLQFEFYLELITHYRKDSRYLSSPPLGFIFLQEPDIFLSSNTSHSPEIEEKKRLTEKFLQRLAEFNWGFIMTEKSDHCRPLVILYDKYILAPCVDSKKAIFPSKNNRMQGLEATFNLVKNPSRSTKSRRKNRINRPADKKIKLANLHMDYGNDNNQLLADYLFQQRNENFLTIIGGDLNQARNSLYFALGSHERPTVLTEEMINGNASIDDFNRSICDSFMAIPSQGDARLKARDISQYYFNLMGGGTLHYLPEFGFPQYFSPNKGLPCINRDQFNLIKMYKRNQYDAPDFLSSVPNSELQINQNLSESSHVLDVQSDIVPGFKSSKKVQILNGEISSSETSHLESFSRLKI